MGHSGSHQLPTKWCRRPVNLNKVFPRLTISAKLAIAFVLVAIVPLLMVAVAGTQYALGSLRTSTEAGLRHDVELAETRTARALREAEQHVTYVAEIIGGDVLGNQGAPDRSRRIIRSYLASDPTALFSFKAVDLAGRRRLFVDQRVPEGTPEDLAPLEPLYLWASAELEAGARAFLPIEVRSERDSTKVTPAIAILVPVYRGEEYLGVMVGEAEAELLFDGLEQSAPAFTGGVTALADEEGRFLFHSRYKREWGTLLAGESDLDITVDIPSEIVDQVMTGGEGSLRLADGRFLSYRTISVGATHTRSLVLYRMLPASVVDARVRRVLFVFGGLGALMSAIVLAVSTVAARQITRPVYALRNAARELTRGGVPSALDVSTNDELEDLADDFDQMATTIVKHRTELETLVQTRTRQLLKTEAHLGRIVTDAGDAILALTPGGEITLWNRGAERLFGYTQDQALGASVSQLLGSPNGIEGDRKAPRAMTELRTRRRARDGTWIPVTLTKSKVHGEDGSVVGHSLVIRDERARESLEEQMRRSERLAAISIMAGGIAHELNNPLSILGNRIELMQREAIRRDAGVPMLEDLEVLRKHVGRIGSVTSDLLRFARDDVDDLSAVDVNDVVDRVTRLLAKVFEEAGLDLEVVTGDDIGFILGSESVVETVLVNLLLNARQATPAGGWVRVVVRKDEDGSEVYMEVHDSGPGVPDDLRRRIFEPFFTTRAGAGGTGLGLAVCRALVDRVGARLQLVSCEGKGAIFIVALPRKVEGSQ